MREANPAQPPSPSPAASLLANLRAELTRVLPFARMAPEHVDEFIAGAAQAYFAPDEVLLEPGMGPVGALHYVRKGSAKDMRPDNGKYDRMINIWRRLPVGLTRLIGPAIVRGIPS